MATEVVVKESLTDGMVAAGAELTRQLDKARLIVSSSLWLFTRESNGWRLVIASPEVRTRGPRWFYRRIQSIISRMPDAQARVPLKDISVLDSNDPLIRLLKIAIKTDEGISDIRFTQNVINGTFIEDAYIYRMT